MSAEWWRLTCVEGHYSRQGDDRKKAYPVFVTDDAARFKLDQQRKDVNGPAELEYLPSPCIYSSSS